MVCYTLSSDHLDHVMHQIMCPIAIIPRNVTGKHVKVALSSKRNAILGSGNSLIPKYAVTNYGVNGPLGIDPMGAKVVRKIHGNHPT